MITELTIEQKTLLPVYRDKWLNHFFSLEFDEKKAKKLVHFIFEKLLNNPKPKIVIMDSPLGVQLAINNYPQVGSQVGSQVGFQVRLQIGSKIGFQIKSQIKPEIGSFSMSQIEPEIGSFSMSQIEFQIRNQEKLKYYSIDFYGDFTDYSWVAYYDFCLTELLNEPPKKHSLFKEYKELITANIFNMVSFEKVVFISKPPIFLNRDDMNRLHCSTDYAIYFKDGYGQHYIHGIYFSPDDFDKFVKNKPNPVDVIGLENTEQKSALIQLYGIEYFIDNLPNLRVIDEMEYKYGQETIYKQYRLLRFNVSDTIEFQFLQCNDHTTNKPYFLGIPLNITKCYDAVPWTVNISPEMFWEKLIKYS